MEKRAITHLEKNNTLPIILLEGTFVKIKSEFVYIIFTKRCPHSNSKGNSIINMLFIVLMEFY